MHWEFNKQFTKNKFLDINFLESDKLEFAFTHYERINNAFRRMYNNKGMVDEYIYQRTAKLKYEALRIIGFNDDEVSEILEMSKMNKVKDKFIHVHGSIDSTLVEEAFKYIVSNKYTHNEILSIIKLRRKNIEYLIIEQMKSRSLIKSTNGKNKTNRRRQINL